jgi:hypothetical protein
MVPAVSSLPLTGESMKISREKCVEYEDITCDKDTDAAILVEIEGEEYWIPKSQIHDDSEVYQEGTSGQLVISQWIAEQKGLV